MRLRDLSAGMRHHPVVAVVAATLLVGAAVIAVTAVPAATPSVEAATGCRIFVASGDDYTNGKDLNDSDKRYPEQLLADHLIAPGWCVYNQGKNGQTSATYISAGGLASAYNMRPDLLTIQLGEQNTTIVKLITSCFDNVKDHEFSQATSCAAQILANSSLWTSLKSNYTTILQQTRIMMSQRPQLVVAVVGYPNPYPKAADATAQIAPLCTPLIDNVLPCTTRWALLPPALTTIDQVFQKLNQSLKEAIAPFNQGPSGNRWVFVDTYPKLRDHCMKMEVQMRTTVEHPEQNGVVHQHDNFSKVNFGCSSPWFVAGSDGTKIPTYLDPSTPGVLINKSQTTSGMGVYPDADGHQCIADAIWEADTIDPGTTPLKWKLGYGEAARSDICQ